MTLYVFFKNLIHCLQNLLPAFFFFLISFVTEIVDDWQSAFLFTYQVHTDKPHSYAIYKVSAEIVCLVIWATWRLTLLFVLSRPYLPPFNHISSEQTRYKISSLSCGQKVLLSYYDRIKQ